MDSWEGLRVSDPAVAARYLQLRSHFHDRLLAQVERHVTEHYQVQPARRIPPTLVAVTRSGQTARSAVTKASASPLTVT